MCFRWNVKFAIDAATSLTHCSGLSSAASTIIGTGRGRGMFLALGASPILGTTPARGLFRVWYDRFSPVLGNSILNREIWKSRNSNHLRAQGRLRSCTNLIKKYRPHGLRNLLVKCYTQVCLTSREVAGKYALQPKHFCLRISVPMSRVAFGRV